MTRWIAFFRAVNVGGTGIVKMAALRDAFEALGYTEVATIGASGNVGFLSPARNSTRLAGSIAAGLKSKLDRDLQAVLRTVDEVRDIVARCPFEPGDDTEKVFITLLPEAPAPDPMQVILAEAADAGTERMEASEREIFTLMKRERIPKARYSNAWLERKLKQTVTTRDINTLRRVVEKWG